jgi:hypothetical protein
MMFDMYGQPFAVTLEHTFADGKSLLSPGVYDCHRDKYHKGGYDTFEIEVQGHDRILFHKANLETQLAGCVAIGEKFEDFNGVPGIAESGIGFNQFWAKYGMFERIQLDIKEMEIL